MKNVTSHSHRTRCIIAASALSLVLGAVLSCGGDYTSSALGNTIEYDAIRPLAASARRVSPYTGTNAIVLSAQARYPDALLFHEGVIVRTCGPTNGVCHNQQEYPDLHTPANFLAAIGAPCNVQPREHGAVFDRCERSGDRLRLEGVMNDDIEVGYVEYITAGQYIEHPDQSMPPAVDEYGLHIYLRDPVTSERRVHYATGRFVRTFVDSQNQVQERAFASFETRWWILEDGRHIFGEVRPYQTERVQELLQVGIVQGDLNRNGTFGAREANPIAMIAPGHPEESYLIARVRGQMLGAPIPGTQMPLANQPLSVEEMLALFCWVQGLPEIAGLPISLSDQIDYATCPYSADPNNLDVANQGVPAVWATGIKPLLERNCQWCHGGSNVQGGFDVLASDLYQRLAQASVGKPALKLVEAGNPDASYLYMKLMGTAGIVGKRMPLDPTGGERPLNEQSLAAVREWIMAGALEN